MKRIVCQQPGQFELGEAPLPVPKSGEALLRIHRVGICGTDLHAYQGNQAYFKYPRILGHELSAEVLSVGQNEQGIQPGDRVIVMPYRHCGTCGACRVGKTNCCRNLEVLGVHVDGGMQEQFTVRTDLLIPAGALSYEEAAVVEPLAIGAHALRRAGARKGETIVVVGCGPIGIGLLALGSIIGCRTIALDTNSDRLAFVSDKMGITETVLVDEDSVEGVKVYTGSDLAEIVFDATGNRRALESGVRYLAHGGRYVLVGLSKGDLTFNHPEIHAKESSLLCSRNATREDFEWVRDILESGQFPVESYITHQVSYERMIDDFDSWILPETGVIKAMVNWTE